MGIPEGWRLLRLGECLSEVKERNKKLGKWPVLSITNQQGFVLSEEYFERHVYSHDLRNYKIIRRGQFAYNPTRLNVGSLARLNSFEAGLLSPIYVVFKVLPNINADFLHFWLSSAKVKNLIKARTQGTVRDVIAYPTLCSLPIFLPPLDEQKKMALIFTNIESALKKTKAVMNQISRFKKALMQELFTKGLPDKHKKFKKSSFGKMPADWKIVKLGEVCLEKPEYGANVPAIAYDPQLPRYVRITDISQEGRLIPGSRASINNEAAQGYLLHDDDLVFARSGATVGKTYLYKKFEGKCAYAGYLIKVKLDKTQLLPEFLFHFTHSPYYYRWIKRVLRAGAQPNINAKEYAHLNIPLPPIKEQGRISSLLSKIDTYKEKEMLRLNNLFSLKSALIQKKLGSNLYS